MYSVAAQNGLLRTEQRELLHCIRIVFFVLTVEELQCLCYNIKSGLYFEELLI